MYIFNMYFVRDLEWQYISEKSDEDFGENQSCLSLLEGK
jgi:hypothetical protein